MKKIFYLSIFFFLLCCKKNISFYDVEGPLLNFCSFLENGNIIMQFNEPIVKMKLSFSTLKDNVEKTIENKFPKANIIINKNEFKENKNEFIKISSIDTKGNVSEINVKAPVVNDNPAIIEFNEIQLKYSKTKNQYIIFNVIKEGNIKGFSLTLFIKGEKIELPFNDNNVKIGDKFYLNINYDKENKNNKYQLNYLNKNQSITLKSRLSLDNSLIYIKNNKNEIIDYLLYYNLKKKTKDDFAKNKKFQKYLIELKKNKITEPKIFDIKSISLKNPIKKLSKDFIVKN